MELITVINEELPNILKQLVQETIHDPLLKEVVDAKKVTFSIKEQAKLLEEIFGKYLQNEEFIKNKNKLESVCWRFYKDVDIPFAIIYKTLTNLKSRVMAHVIYSLSTKNGEVFEIEHFIDDLINLVAKVYIKKDTYKLSSIYTSQFESYLLFHSHLQWLEDITDAIKTDDMTKFPLQNHMGCDFSKHLQYPESLMVCMDANLCSTLHDLHQTLHKNANTFYMFYSQGQFYQSYIVLQEFVNNVTNFKKVVTELYFLSYNNLEENFYKLIELLLYHKDKLYLTIIDFHKLRSLNATYGQSTVNQLLEHIDQKLQEQVHNQEENTLLIKATTANYYMLSVNVSTEEIKTLNQKLYEITNKSYTVNNKEIDLETTIVTLALDGFAEKRRDELTKMMLHLKSTYKQTPRSHYVHSEKEILDLKNWVEASYKDMDYIDKKLRNKEIDVVFQPLFDVQTGEVRVLEALARIKEKNKLIPAGVFIDALYDMDKIEVLDQVVLERLIEKKNLIMEVASVLFVNVSYRSLFDRKYQESFKEFLEAFRGFDVVFELTEQSLVENIEKIQELHNSYGVKFAVDDFGTGYSSLKTVADLSDKDILKVLKMDGEIVKSINTKRSTSKIIKAISTLSQELELCSVAEFVENQDILDTLQTMGVTYAQGYLLSKPHTIEELLVKKLNESLDFTKNKGIV